MNYCLNFLRTNLNLDFTQENEFFVSNLNYFKFVYHEIEQLKDAENCISNIKKLYPFVYIWLAIPKYDIIFIIRPFGGNKIQIFSEKWIEKSEYFKKLSKTLNSLTSENFDELFESYSAFNVFFRDLWNIRIKVAMKIKTENSIDNSQALLLAQQILNRFIFIFFLMEKQLIRDFRDNPINSKQLFKIISELDNPYKVIKSLFFTFLGSNHDYNKEYLEISPEFKIKIPFLGGVLFSPKKIQLQDSFQLESELTINSYDWGEIFKLFNRFTWIMNDRLPNLEDFNYSDYQGNLTPAIIGFIYEKFVISMAELQKNCIDMDLDIGAFKISGDEMKIGNKVIGAYYTPEEITRYMVENTVYPYILDKINEQFRTNYKKIDTLFLLDKEKQDDKIDHIKYLYFNILQSLKICDNAGGSGAFLVMIIDILFRLYMDCIDILKNKEIFIEEKDLLITNATIGYNIKRRIIINNVYAVDIQESALEMSKLRLYLSLISEMDTQSNKVDPLPNIDFNILSGNSLIGFIKIPKSDLIIAPLIKQKERLMEGIKDDLNPEDLKQLQEINLKLRNGLDNSLFRILKSKTKITKEEFNQIKPFHWVLEFPEIFSENGNIGLTGFDIIIGNPPYIENKKMGGPFIHKEAQKLIYKSAHGLYDYSILFIERSWKLLKRNGYFSYIIPNKNFAADYGEVIRNFILTKTNLEKLLNVSKIGAFKKIATYPIIMFFKKAKFEVNCDVMLGINIQHLNQISTDHFDKLYIKQEKFMTLPGMIIPISEKLKLTEEIRNSSDIVTLEELGGNDMKYRLFGFTNYDSIFEKVVKTKPEDGDCLKFMGTRNLKRFAVDESITFVSKGYKFKNSYLPYDIEFREFWDLFKQEKLLIKEVSKKLTVSYDSGEYVSVTGMYMFRPNSKSPNISMFYLLGVLNSSLINYIYNAYYENAHMAGGYLNVHKSYLLFLPIKIPTDEEHEVVKFLSKALYLLAKLDNIMFEPLNSILDYIIFEIYFKDLTSSRLTELILPKVFDINLKDLNSEVLNEIQNKIYTNFNDDEIGKIIRNLKAVKPIQAVMEISKITDFMAPKGLKS